jgi:amidohydrolase
MDKQKLSDVLIPHFEWFHRNPELSLKEFKTSAHIKNALTEAGVEILETGLETGLVAIVRGGKGGKGGKNGKTVALRADIDALPVEEKTGLPYRSQTPGCAHACGHDFHTTVLLGAALLLKEKEKELEGNVKLVFQCAEELAGGAEMVIKTGALDDVTEIFGLHVIPAPHKKRGSLGISAGPGFAAAIKFSITLTGIGGHAAMPHNCADPIVAAAQLIGAAQTIVSRRSSPFDPLVVSFTRIEAGKAWNVIPNEAFIEGTIRSFGTEKAKEAVTMLEKTGKGIEEAFNVRVDLRWEINVPSTNNDAALSAFAKETAEAAGLTVLPFEPIMAGEDFALYQQKCPGVFIGYNIDSPFALHHPEFLVPKAELPAAASVLALLAEKAAGRRGMDDGV